METKITTIGNSKGVRIPKALLATAKLKGRVRFVVRKDGLLLQPVNDDTEATTAELSEKALGEWLSPEEDAAWANLK